MDEVRAIELYREITGSSEGQARSAYMYLPPAPERKRDGPAVQENPGNRDSSR